MQTVILDFNTRVEEVNNYFDFIESLIREKTKLITYRDEQDVVDTLEPNLAKTLKANGFLLLYNLVESSMTNAIEAIFDELRSQHISFNSIRLELKKIVIQNFKNRSSGDVHRRVRDISVDIISAGFKSRELFSGNIDCKEITNTARKYGFSYDTDYAKTRHGKSLSNIMRNRNDLAHGNKSFADVGREVSIDELIQVKSEVIEYIGQILRNIKAYLDGQHYLDTQ